MDFALQPVGPALRRGNQWQPAGIAFQLVVEGLQQRRARAGDQIGSGRVRGQLVDCGKDGCAYGGQFVRGRLGQHAEGAKARPDRRRGAGGLRGVTFAQLFAQQLPAQVREQNERESRSAAERGLYDDVQVAAKYWYESRNPKNIPAMDEALEKMVPAGMKFSNRVADFTTWEKAQECKAYHTAGAVLLAKAYTLLYYGDVKKAAPAIELIENKFRYSMCLYEDRSVMRVRERLRFHEHEKPH